MKQQIADIKLEKAGMKEKINMLTFGLKRFVSCDDDIGFTGFPSYSGLTSFYEFLVPSDTRLNYWGSDNKGIVSQLMSVVVPVMCCNQLTKCFWYRLKYNILEKDLGDRFSIDSSII